MGNMAYCRFENTLEALRDCWDYMDDTELSSDEERARKSLLRLCREMASQYYTWDE